MAKITVRIESADGATIEKWFDADQGGEAYALTRAIGMLFARMSPAIRMDHKNHEEGNNLPQTPFGYKE